MFTGDSNSVWVSQGLSAANTYTNPNTDAHTKLLLHGEAVAVDMAFSTVLAFTRGHIDAHTRDLILETLRRLELPMHHPMHGADLCERALATRRPPDTHASTSCV